MNQQLRFTLFTILVLFAANSIASAQSSSSFAKWSKIEFSLTGPDSKGQGTPNPFAVQLNAEFTGPSGRKYSVPGFYDGDGRGGLDGNVWKVRFSADAAGMWRYETKSSHKKLNGQSGTFRVQKSGANAKGFWKWGRLESVGTAKNRIRYLKFRDGPYWLKAGCDDPENFLGNYKHYNTLAKRKAAIDYLAGKEINSFYIMTHNLSGDDNDVWPWLGATAKQAKQNGGKDARFDIGKLEEWRRLFEYMQSKGVVPYLVLEDDSAWDGYDHKRYYRELVARFGYLPALLFNFNEEHNENYNLKLALGYMKLLSSIDPYDHPRGIHNVNSPNSQYVDAPFIDFTSIQTGSVNRPKSGDPLGFFERTVDWIELCKERGKRILMVNFDEGRPEHDRRAWWSAYLAGGVWEAHVGKPYDRPMSAWEPVWTELGGARAFMETLPFWEMHARMDLVKKGRAICFAKEGKAYALYLPAGGSVDVSLSQGSYEVAWWNPANGKDGRFERRGKTNGGVRRFTAPGKGDWALRILRK